MGRISNEHRMTKIRRQTYDVLILYRDNIPVDYIECPLGRPLLEQNLESNDEINPRDYPGRGVAVNVRL